MKRCPQCNRVETEETLKFCRVDGATLVPELSFPGSEAGTAQLTSAAISYDAQTGILPHATESNINRVTAPTTVLRGQPAPATTGALSEPLSKPKGRRTAIVLAVIFTSAIAAVTAIVVDTYRSRHSTNSIQSIAVLPFENKNSDADTDYLSDGLADSLIFRLTQLPGLKVSPATSVMRYKGKENDVAKIASELGVDAVITGRLLKRGDNLNITVELIDVRNNKSLWGEQYERKMSDLLSTQREIASVITQKLQLKLSGNEKALVKHYTENNDAYQLYLKGRYYWNKRDEENLTKAIEQFKGAADKDPNFALAFVGLADCYAVLPFYSSTSSNEEITRAKAYAERAIEIDDSLGEAHTSLGYVNVNLWNWADAEKELKKGVELNPNYGTAHKFYGNYLSEVGRFDEGLAEFKRAQELEPLSLIISANLAELYLTNGNLNGAAEQCHRALDLDPNWYYVRQLLALVYLKQGRNAEALTEAEKSVELTKRLGNPLGTLGYIYSQTGKRVEALQVIEELKSKQAERRAYGLELARVYVGLGDKDAAFAWLEKDFQAHASTLPAWIFIPPLDSLRDDPRFKDLTRRIGIPG
jgi:TolB-like protein/Tfp pilus assembly protein PilF